MALLPKVLFQQITLGPSTITRILRRLKLKDTAHVPCPKSLEGLPTLGSVSSRAPSLWQRAIPEPAMDRFVGQGDLERQSLLRRVQGETMHPEGLWKATTVLKPNESRKEIYLPRRYGETLENRSTDIEDLEVTLEIARGCADRHAALKVALLENQLMQMWHIRERRLVVISAENALLEEEQALSL